jgi:hypothetical protein
METAASIVAPEGIYSLTEELKPQVIQLVTTTPALYPTRTSTVTINFPSKAGGQGLSGLLSGSRGQPQQQQPQQQQKERDAISASSSDNVNQEDAGGSNGSSAAINASGQGASSTLQQHSLFGQPQSATNGKRKAHTRPKHNMKTTSSAFVTRHQTTEGLGRILQSKQGDVTFVIFNSSKAIFWSEVGVRAKVRAVALASLDRRSRSQVQEPLARVAFSAYPTCHDINLETVATDRLDVVIGFSTGDLVWFGEQSPRPSTARPPTDLGPVRRYAVAIHATQ